MSRSSIKPLASPTIQDNDELAAGAEQGSYHEAFRGSESNGHGVIDAGGSGTGGHRSSRTITNYPFDENLFYTTPTQPAFPEAREEDEAEVAGDIAYEEPPPEQLIHPPDFKLFFTLLEDPETGEYVHPTVHYMFADDDPEILTSAVLETLDRSEEGAENKKISDEVEERYVIVDIGANGKSVVSSSSLSPEWQALQTSITQAPSWGEEGENAADRGFMLKISGRSKRAFGAGKDGRRQQETAAGNIEDLVRSYGERLDRLTEIMGGGS